MAAWTMSGWTMFGRMWRTQDAGVGGAEGAGGLDELALTDGHDLRADQSCVADPAGKRQGQNEVEQAGAEERDKGDGEQDAGQGEEGVVDVDVQDGVRKAAVEACERAGDQTKRERDRPTTETATMSETRAP